MSYTRANLYLIHKITLSPSSFIIGTPNSSGQVGLVCGPNEQCSAVPWPRSGLRTPRFLPHPPHMPIQHMLWLVWDCATCSTHSRTCAACGAHPRWLERGPHEAYIPDHPGQVLDQIMWLCGLNPAPKLYFGHPSFFTSTGHFSTISLSSTSVFSGGFKTSLICYLTEFPIKDGVIMTNYFKIL